MPETRLVTAEDLLEMGEGRRELIRGEVVELSPSGYEHSHLGSRIAYLIQRYLDEQPLGSLAGADGGFRVEMQPDTVRVPDVSFVAADRFEGVDRRKFLPFAPDLAVEIVSPSDRFAEVEGRAGMWLGFGSRLVWVVEPESRRVMVYTPDGRRATLAEADELTGGDVLPGFRVAVSEIFRS